MYKNFIRIASANIKTNLLNIEENKKEILRYIEFIRKTNIDITIFPELTLTGISAGDFLGHTEITERAEKALYEILENTKDLDSVIILGLPFRIDNDVISGLFVLYKGHIANIIQRTEYTNEENRIFSNNSFNNSFYNKMDKEYVEVSSSNIILTINNIKTQVTFESDIWDRNTEINPNANILLIAGNSSITADTLSTNKSFMENISKKYKIAIAYSGASNYESSSYGVYSSQKYIMENGKTIEEGKAFSNGLIYNDINIYEIQKSTSFLDYLGTNIDISKKEYAIKRNIEKYPYLPSIENNDTFIKNILEIQSEALVRRLRQLPTKKIFLGISGGLDSTLSLIVSSLAFYKLGLDSKDIFTITMPGLGTSNRTKNNATNLAKAYNTTFKEISIKESVIQHFNDIEHDINEHDVTFENAQARERTQVLMDLANKHGGLVLGTGNMSEIALGWATFNGDHMAMYGVNSGLPKTLLREVVRYVANKTNNELLKNTLNDIIDTPISPELLPTNEDGKIAQKTENSVGPYELHDFFIYHLVRNKTEFNDIKFMANLAFSDKYSNEEIEKWFNKFISRFTTQAFKRNVSPDAPQILDYSLDHRSGFIMPSDIDPSAFL